MEKGIKQFGAIGRVGGAFVCDNRGEVIVSSSPAVLATVTMNTIGREVGRAFFALEAAHRAARRLDFRFDAWRLLAQDIGDAVLFVVCEPDVDMALVRMTADVVAAAWEQDPRVRKRLDARRSDREQLINVSSLDHSALQSWTLIQSR